MTRLPSSCSSLESGTQETEKGKTLDEASLMDVAEHGLVGVGSLRCTRGCVPTTSPTIKTQWLWFSLSKPTSGKAEPPGQPAWLSQSHREPQPESQGTSAAARDEAGILSPKFEPRAVVSPCSTMQSAWPSSPGMSVHQGGSGRGVRVLLKAVDLHPPTSV